MQLVKYVAMVSLKFDFPCFVPEQLEAPHLTATAPLVPPLRATVNGLMLADDDLNALAHPTVDKKKPVGALPRLDTKMAGKCLPPPPANGIVICATTGRYPVVRKFRKKQWSPFEEVAGRLAKDLEVGIIFTGT